MEASSFIERSALDRDTEDHDFDAAYRTYHPALVRHIALIVGDLDEAQDLAQRAFLRAWERGPLPHGSDLLRWLMVVGTRMALDERRRRRRWGLFPIRETDAEWAMEADPDLWLAMARLGRNVRAALVMSALDGYTQTEIAEILGVPRSTVASWLVRGRLQIRQRLEGGNHEMRRR